MLAAARTLVQKTGGDVIAILLGHNAQGLAGDLNANKITYIDHPLLSEFTFDAYQQALTPLLQDDPPRAILFGHTSIGMDVASTLSERFRYPIISQCRSFDSANGGLKFISQICGGKILAEGVLPEPVVFVTMVPGGYKPEEGQSTQPPDVSEIPAPDLEGLRVQLRQYIEPDAEDVDISQETLLIAVGRGLQNQDDLELVEELATALGGTVCASRPIIDQGWLPITRLVGKSGKKVKPTLYLVLGISGAPEHVEGMEDSELIIAVNTDPDAPIYNIAQYGAEVDLLDLVSALTEQLEHAATT
jgi:electron transfer flavoprotein alpha subunit